MSYLHARLPLPRYIHVLGDGGVGARGHLDADHATESVRRDITAWLPKVAEGGVLAGHDIDASSVAAAVTMPHLVCGRCWVKL